MVDRFEIIGTGSPRPEAERILFCDGTGGSLYRLRLTRNRRKVDVSDPKLAERVADNLGKFEGTESESLLIGRGFGITPSIEQGPDGNLYVVSLTDGAIYMISRQ